MRISLAVAWSVSAALLGATSLSAQIQAGPVVGFAFPSGDYWDHPISPGPRAKHGPVVGGQVMIGIFRAGQVGVGLDYSSIAVEGSDDGIAVLDIAAFLRYFLTLEGARFFIGGKFAYSRHSTTRVHPSLPGSVPFDVVHGGAALGPTIGVQVPTGGIHIELAVDVLRDAPGGTWDDASRGETVFYASGTGLRIVPRVGIALGSTAR